ncbi:MAG TPA: ATP-binding protein [Ramlibacter sp.]|jgi:anti-sigma regulatory factor (Ser/Thr protein kinase)
MIVGSFHAVFPMEDPSRVGEARRHAVQLAHECGFDDIEAGRLAIVVTELGTNLLRHARSGRLLLSTRTARGEVEVVAIDEGPGMADVHRALDDGYSTGTTPGTGLGAVRRLATEFDLHSSVPQGTVVVARIRAAASLPAPPAARQAIAVGAIALAAPGERVCGDAWAFAIDGDRAALIVADGLGHGPDAAEASKAAVAAFAQDPMTSPAAMLASVHARLRSTRGAAVLVLQADGTEGVVRSAGAGNVMGRLISGTTDRTILSQHGTAGVTIRTPDEASTAWPPHALLVACSDGIATRWQADVLAPVLGRDPVLAAAILVRDQSRGRDDATAAVLRRRA